MCSFAGASVMSHHKLKPESRRRSFSHSPGGQGSEVKGSVRPRSPCRLSERTLASLCRLLVGPGAPRLAVASLPSLPFSLRHLLP